LSKRVQLMNEDFQITAWSESAVAVQFGQKIDPDLHKKVKALTLYLEHHPFEGLLEVVPAFANVTVFFDPVIISIKNERPSTYVSALLKEILLNLQAMKTETERTVVIPVCYGGEFGPDLEFVAQYNHLSVEEVIHIHSESEYLVYMIGFAPGFPYLGGLSERIATPRKSKPRLRIPAGAVGIGGAQTGVYSISTPGGWQLIGQTPLTLFLQKEDRPSLLRSGDRVRFQPVSRNEYDALKEDQKWR